MSVIIICVILVLITSTLSLTGFYGRFNMLDSELKERSSAAAEACIDQGLLLIANATSHTATTTYVFYPSQCDLGPIPGSGNPRIFYTQASTSNYFTTYKISANPTTFVINSVEEIPKY